jgi:hypothetical protein
MIAVVVAEIDGDVVMTVRSWSMLLLSVLFHQTKDWKTNKQRRTPEFDAIGRRMQGKRIREERKKAKRAKWSPEGARTKVPEGASNQNEYQKDL